MVTERHCLSLLPPSLVPRLISSFRSTRKSLGTRLTTSRFCLMLFIVVSQLVQAEGVGRYFMCLWTLSHSSLFSHSFLLSIFPSIPSSLFFLPFPPLLPLFQSCSNLSVECVQVCTYSGHRDGVWQVSHTRNGLSVIGSASAGILV